MKYGSFFRPYRYSPRHGAVHVFGPHLQTHRVPNGTGHVRHVQRQLGGAYHAPHRAAPAVDQPRQTVAAQQCPPGAEQPVHPVPQAQGVGFLRYPHAAGIARRQQSQTRGPLGAVRAGIAHLPARRQVLQLHDLRLQPADFLQPQWVRHRQPSQQRRAQTHRVQLHLRIPQKCGGGADVAQTRLDTGPLQQGRPLLKLLVLPAGQGFVGGVGEVGEHPLHPHRWQAFQQGGGLRHVLRQEAEAAHAGVQLHVDAGSDAFFHGHSGHRLCRSAGAHRQDGAAVQQDGHIPGYCGGGQHQHLRRDPRLTQSRSLLRRGHSQHIHAVLRQKAGVVRQAQPVAVPLHHADDAGRRGSPQPVQVPCQRRGVDDQCAHSISLPPVMSVFRLYPFCGGTQVSRCRFKVFGGNI